MVQPYSRTSCSAISSGVKRSADCNCATDGNIAQWQLFTQLRIEVCMLHPDKLAPAVERAEQNSTRCPQEFEPRWRVEPIIVEEAFS
jgi:hypothetical protein